MCEVNRIQFGTDECKILHLEGIISHSSWGTVNQRKGVLGKDLRDLRNFTKIY